MFTVYLCPCQPVVIEAKSRTNKLLISPPLHDQIQLVTYMLMTQSSKGDLLQSIRTVVSSVCDETDADLIIDVDSDDASDDISASEGLTTRNRRRKVSSSTVITTTTTTTAVTATATARSTTSISVDEDFKMVKKSKQEVVVVDLSHDENGSDLNPCAGKHPSTAIKEEETKVDECLDVVTKSVSESSTTVVDDTGLLKSLETAADVKPAPEPKKYIYKPADIHIHRIDLNDDVCQHGRHFFSDVLPRLRTFSAAVHTMRNDDSLRYRWLLGTDEEKVSILYELCPYLEGI